MHAVLWGQTGRKGPWSPLLPFRPPDHPDLSYLPRPWFLLLSLAVATPLTHISVALTASCLASGSLPPEEVALPLWSGQGFFSARGLVRG